MTTRTSPAQSRAAVDRLLDVADVAVGVSVGVTAAAARWALRGGRWGARAVAPAVPVVQGALRPSGLAERYWPQTVLRAAAERGREEREAAVDAAVHAVLALVPETLDAALDQVDLTALVIERVDLDAVAAALDLDAAVERVDVDAVVDRIDLLALAQFVIDGVDLPAIIRGSTGSMASEGVRGVRTQTMDADEWVGRVVDRMLLRRNGRNTATTVAALDGASSHGGDRS